MWIAARRKRWWLSQFLKIHQHTCCFVDRVATFKLLGVYVSCDFEWSEHVDAIVYKAASRLHFFRQLKRAGTPIRDLLNFYISVLWPVLEYARLVWHSSLTVSQSNTLNQSRNVPIPWSTLALTMRLRWLLPASTQWETEERNWQRDSLRDKSSPAVHHSTTCFLITMTMTLSVGCKILNLSTQSKHAQINSVNPTLLFGQLHTYCFKLPFVLTNI